MDEGAEDRAQVRVMPPLVPLATILFGVGLQRLWPLPIFVAAPARYWLGGLVVVAALLGLGLHSVVLFRRSGQSELPWKPTPSIVESGPYRLTRNPMYLQMVLVCVGFSIILSNAWILLLTRVLRHDPPELGAEELPEEPVVLGGVLSRKCQAASMRRSSGSEMRRRSPEARRTSSAPVGASNEGFRMAKTSMN
ncbi:MAG: methyltransferase [Longimicrobiales bacterium]